MKTLADEMLAALPTMMAGDGNGPTLAEMSVRLSAALPNVRAAAHELCVSGGAKLARRGRTYHLLPISDPTPVCIICHGVFQPVAKKTRACSHSCARRMAWQNEAMRERHRSSLKRTKSTPEAKANASKVHKARCADPSYRSQMSERNRASWADPATRAKRLVSIDKAWKDPERVDKASKRRTRDWQDPAFRQKAVAAMRKGKRGRTKRAVLKLAEAHPYMTTFDIAGRLGKPSEAVTIIIRKAIKDGEMERRPGDLDYRRTEVRVMARAATCSGVGP